MSATDMIYKIIDEKCLKQSAVARAAGYDPKKFNALLRGRKRLTSDDVVPICKALGITPNELFGIDHCAATSRTRAHEKSPGEGREVKMMPFWLGVIILSASALGVVIAVVGMFRLRLEYLFHQPGKSA